MIGREITTGFSTSSMPAMIFHKAAGEGADEEDEQAGAEGGLLAGLHGLAHLQVRGGVCVCMRDVKR